MERTDAEHTQAPSSSRPRNDRFLVLAVTAVVAALATTTLVTVLLLRDSSQSASPTAAETPSGQSGFILFDDFHVTLLLSPGLAGENTLDLIVARHDGSAADDVTGITVAVSQNGGQASELEAEPAGAPGEYRVSGLPLPTAGDWEFEVSVSSATSEPVSDTTVIAIGAPADN